MFALAGIFNPDTPTGYLAKFGGWVSQSSMTSSTILSQVQTLDAVHIDAWHGSISIPYSNLVIQSIFVSKVGAPSGHTRTYLGFSDGTIGYLVNPCVPNPAACSAYRFSVGDSWVDFPIWNGTYHGSVKSLRNLAVTGPLINAANNVSVEYMTDPQATSWTAFPWTFNSGTFDIKAFPNDVTAILARFRVHLHNTDPTQTPLVSSVTLGHALRPRRYMQIEIEILCSDGLVRRDGVPMRMGRRQIQQLVEAAVDEPGSVTCTLPDESVQELSFTDYAISQSFDEIGRQWRGSLSIKAVQWERFQCGD